MQANERIICSPISKRDSAAIAALRFEVAGRRKSVGCRYRTGRRPKRFEAGPSEAAGLARNPPSGKGGDDRLPELLPRRAPRAGAFYFRDADARRRSNDGGGS